MPRCGNRAHEKDLAKVLVLLGIGIGIAFAIEIAIDEHSDSEAGTDSDPEVSRYRLYFRNRFDRESWGHNTVKSKAAMTLDRVLSRFGLSSRSAARQAVLAGRLKVNGRVIRDPDIWVRPDSDAIHLDGKRLRQARKIYLLLYKPKGVITSHGDPQGRRTIYDLLGAGLPWLSPVGRLDQDSSGLILLTNDTEFANLVTDPASRIPKTYLVKLNGIIEDEVIHKLEAGVKLKQGDFARPESVRRNADRGKYSWLEIVLTEGKNREVRRMMEAVGYTVLKLVRTRIGPLALEGLQIGTYRDLTRSEVSAFLRAGHPSASSRRQS